jgi:hypothetical protein
VAKFFATIVYVIEAVNEEAAREQADQLVESPDCPSFVESAWIDHIEEVEEVEETEEDEPGEAWGEGLDEEREDE